MIQEKCSTSTQIRSRVSNPTSDSWRSSFGWRGKVWYNVHSENAVLSSLIDDKVGRMLQPAIPAAVACAETRHFRLVVAPWVPCTKWLSRSSCSMCSLCSKLYCQVNWKWWMCHRTYRVRISSKRYHGFVRTATQIFPFCYPFIRTGQPVRYI